MASVKMAPTCSARASPCILQIGSTLFGYSSIELLLLSNLSRIQAEQRVTGMGSMFDGTVVFCFDWQTEDSVAIADWCSLLSLFTDPKKLHIGLSRSQNPRCHPSHGTQGT